MRQLTHILFLVLILFSACSKSEDPISETQELTIFFVNDVHGQLDNFAKVKEIVDQERQQTNVIVVCSGDIFSGNPAVDNALDKGAPIVDIMNRIGFDVAAIGNHEFDYGIEILQDRMNQSDFEWICANVDVGTTSFAQPKASASIELGDLKVTFLGFVETNGKQDGTIPSAHPWKMEGLTFIRPENVIGNYSALKNAESADLIIALSHLGFSGYQSALGDVQLAENFPWFDLIIGGHSHQLLSSEINGIPIVQAGSYLNYLGKIELTVENKTIVNYSSAFIDLNSYVSEDATLRAVIDEYNNLPYLNDVIGHSAEFMDQGEVGSFYCDALLSVMDVDIAFQNTGGVRASIDAGDITKREIFEVSPFNNGTVIYEMTSGEVKSFLRGSGSGFYYSGVAIDRDGQEVILLNSENKPIPNDQILRVGINDYVPAVYDSYFPENGNRKLLTAAETLIYYLENVESTINYEGVNRYFRYN